MSKKNETHKIVDYWSNRTRKAFGLPSKQQEYEDKLAKEILARKPKPKSR
jgi:hypothetical protein